MDATLSQTAFEAVRRWILSGKLPAGSAINERQLADRLGLSRTPIREALGRLEGEGHLRRNGRAMFVKEVRVEEIMEILALRLLVETEAVRLATGRLAAEKIREAKQALKTMKRDEISPETHWDVDDFIHLSIAEASGNRLLARLIAELRQRTRMFGFDRIPDRFEPGRAEHLAILSAVEAGNRDAAVAAMRTHLENARAGILDSIAAH